MAEIVAALDTSISSISTVKVFPLRYADSKELAAAVKELFSIPQNNNNNNQRNRFGFGRGGPGAFFGGGGGGGDRGGGGGGDASGDTGNSLAREVASRVVAVADERNNALIIAAPDEYIPTIEDLVAQIDVQANDITELRVFQLKNADPVELATIFGQLFPDETKSGSQGNNNGNNGEFRFGGFPGGGGRRNNNTANNESSRLKKISKVTAVPDQRTSSLIVSAASELMPQIEQMVAQLDSSSARKQKVFVYSLENADVQQVEQILQGMFQRTTTSQYNRNNQNQNSALNSRSQNTQTTIGGQASGVRTGNNNNNNNTGRTR
jgi:type II secretory pathway component GspD/PulD (secretin)